MAILCALQMAWTAASDDDGADYDRRKNKRRGNSCWISIPNACRESKRFLQEFLTDLLQTGTRILGIRNSFRSADDGADLNRYTTDFIVPTRRGEEEKKKIQENTSYSV